MLTKSKIALSLVVVLGTASGAMAATKHKVHHHAAAQAPASAAYGAAKTVPEESYMYVQKNKDGWPGGRPNGWTGGQ
jgi:hypothetical protein